jgi:hypothetical protein
MFYCEPYIDISTFGTKKVAVYPNYIILGVPTFDQKLQRVKFPVEKSIKFGEACFEHFFVFLKKAFKLFENLDIKPVLIYSEIAINEESDLENSENCLFYHGEGPENFRKVVLKSRLNKTNVVFELDFVSFNELCEAFASVFFKFYCYSPIQNIVIEQFVSETKVNEIKTKSFKELCDIIKTIKIVDLTPYECIVIANLIMRHRKILILWRHFVVLKPRYNVSEDKTNLEAKTV